MEEKAACDVTVVICTHNRMSLLRRALDALRAASTPQNLTVGVLVVANACNEETLRELRDIEMKWAPHSLGLRVTEEPRAGKSHALNSALATPLARHVCFIDDDELPEPGMLEAATDAILNEGADCVGGPIRIDFEPFGRPAWLDNDIAGFLGALDHGPHRLWVEDEETPVWSGNVAYRMEIFRHTPELRFDIRYNREGAGIGGGSDAIMFRTLVSRKARIRYRPDMVIRHLIDEWKLQRRYFLRLHYRAGLRRGRYQLPEYSRTVLGVPPFLVAQYLRLAIKAVGMQVFGRPGALRHGMNAANTLGCLIGYSRRATE